MKRAALSAVTAIAYLILAVTPCAPAPEFLPDPSSHEHAAEHAAIDDSVALTAPCLCGCEHSSATIGIAKSGEALLPREPEPMLGRADAQPCDPLQRIPDAPISVASPVPIAA